MNTPSDLRYAKTHEWVRKESDALFTVGISDHAQSCLGDITFVELPKVGARLSPGEPFGVVESVKAASDLYAPVAGEVVEINDSVDQSPEKINLSPYDEGWLIRVRPASPAEFDSLLSAADYEQTI